MFLDNGITVFYCENCDKDFFGIECPICDTLDDDFSDIEDYICEDCGGEIGDGWSNCDCESPQPPEGAYCEVG